MKKVYLYIRVSTDEQKKKGYSLPEQEERLKNYCDFHGLEIVDIYREDHSAKNFNRPAWKRLLSILKKRGKTKSKEEVKVLFVKWDRFSRSVEAAYAMIGILRGLYVSADAIDQPIDFGVPESAVMLAVYLSIPEAENLRRGLNVLDGMRRARKQGRWMGAAPKGYVNRITPDGERKYITPKPGEAEIMKWVFEELAKGVQPAEQIRREANEKGLKCERNNFWKLIRNPVYCGLIIVPQYKNEEMDIVDGQHEPLINKTLFYRVQDVLNGKRRPKTTKIKASEQTLVLRGVIRCPQCTRMLTGSGSKGRHGGRYYYYHCSCNECKFRFKADVVNNYFEREVMQYSLRPETGELFKLVVKDVFQSQNEVEWDDRRDISRQIEEKEAMIAKARQRLMQDEIDAEDFKIIKTECRADVRELEDRLAELPAKTQTMKTLDVLLDRVVTKFMNVQQRYYNAEPHEKRKLVASLYPDFVTFNGEQHRTPRPNEALEVILLINRTLNGIKKGEKSSILDFSPKVARRGIEPLFQE
ncbi:recombinase family protein [Parapedobacter koreensis]|uniref:recombinase family protein n=1 Tax=Parapedobacter koreensis TaxID=332977 RepID=UPI000B850708|nr:recombinase family protein [Parapedobacter koreensis]